MLLDVSGVPAQPVGAGIYTIELARELATRPDLDLVLLTRTNDRERWDAIAPRSERINKVPAARPLRLLWEAQFGGSIAQRSGIDVWHGPHYTLPRALPCRSVVTVHDLTFFDEPETHERAKVAVFQRAIRRNARTATRVVCVSHHTANRLRAVIPIHAPIDVAHHGIDHARFHTPTDATRVTDHELLTRIGVREPFIAFVGTLQPRKGLPALVAAFARVRHEHPDIKLVLAGGDGWGLDALHDAIRTHGVASQVIRPGYVDDPTVAALYRNASVVAYPSLAEGFGLPALEAMACGSALVTTSGTAMDDFVGDGALTVAPNDATALADAMLDAMRIPTAARLRARGPEIAQNFTWSACADTHLRIYRSAYDAPAS